MGVEVKLNLVWTQFSWLEVKLGERVKGRPNSGVRWLGPQVSTGQLKTPNPPPATGRPCLRGDITAATLRDDLFLVHYDCVQLESCLGSRVLKANLDPLLQHPLPAECQRVVKAKLARVCRGPAAGRGGRAPGGVA